MIEKLLQEVKEKEQKNVGKRNANRERNFKIKNK